MIQRKTRTRLLQDSQKELGLAVILMAIFLPGVGSALTPQFPVVDVVKGETAAGRPYMKGGLSSDEQLVMERATRPDNLKLKFTRRVGTPAAPSFIVIGANDGRSIEKIMLRAPWIYIQLPSGGYTILARFQRQIVLVRDVVIWEGRVRTYLLRGD